MKEKRYILCLCALLMLMNVGTCFAVNEQQVEAQDVNQFVAYHTTHPDVLEELLEDPMRPLIFYEFMAFVQRAVTLAVDPQTGSITGIENTYRAFPNLDNLEILNSSDKLVALLRENHIDSIEEYKILYFGFLFHGYVVYVRTPHAAYFIPFLSEGTEFGGFVDRRVYEAEEFAKLCAPQECQLVVFDAVVPTDDPFTMQYERAMVPLRALLEALGFEVSWDVEENTVVFGEYRLLLDKERNPNGDIMKGDICLEGVRHEGGYNGTFEVINWRTMAGEIVLRTLEAELNISIRFDNDQHIVRVQHRE